MHIGNVYHIIKTVEKIFNSKGGDGIDIEVQEKYLEIKDQVTEMIRKHPMETLSASLVAGFIIGKIIKK